MYRPALRATLRPGSRLQPPRRQFHATPHRRSADYGVIVDKLGSVSYAFHDAFQYVHEFTTLPWLVSIPLTTFVLRFSITPFRYYINRCRRDQRLAAPELELAARIVEQQSHAKVAANHLSLEESGKWKDDAFLKWRDRIMQRHRLAKPSVLFDPNDNVDITNVLSSALTTVNISTLVALNYSDPTMFGLEEIETFGSPLSFCFLLFAWYNSNYYCGYPSRERTEPRKFHPVTWSPIRTNIWVAGLPPMVIAWNFVAGPGAVLWFLLSNSIYTFTEIKVINRVLGMPPLDDRYAKYPAQTTKKQKKKRNSL